MRSSIERRGGHDVVQYRGGILPLVSVAALLAEFREQSADRPATDLAAGETVHTIVYAKNGSQVGVVVGQLVDTIEVAVAQAQDSGKAGRRSTVIHGRVTEILDLDVLSSGATVTLLSGWGAAA